MRMAPRSGDDDHDDDHDDLRTAPAVGIGTE
jgi:hypothetical protein